jgi:phage terminase small subunit
MPTLKNQRWERFCQGLAGGMTGDAAYAEAGYAPNRKNAARLKSNEVIQARMRELQDKAEKRFFLTKQFVLEAAIDNLEKARGLRPIRIGSAEEPKDVYIYAGAVANAALRMLGAELGMFADRKDVRLVTSEYANLTDEQLAQKLIEIGQQVLLGPPEGPVIEHDEIGSDRRLSPSGAAHCRPRSR